MPNSQSKPPSPLLPNIGPTPEEKTTLTQMAAWFEDRARGSEAPLSTPYPALNSAPIMSQLSYAMNARHLTSGYGVLQYEGPAIKFDNPKWRKMVGFTNQ